MNTIIRISKVIEIAFAAGALASLIGVFAEGLFCIVPLASCLFCGRLLRDTRLDLEEHEGQ